jgi:hypothetical protein
VERKDERATVKREAKPDDANAGPIWQADDETKITALALI